MTERERGERYGLIWAFAVVLICIAVEFLRAHYDTGLTDEMADMVFYRITGEIAVAVSLLVIIVANQVWVWARAIIRNRGTTQ